MKKLKKVLCVLLASTLLLTACGTSSEDETGSKKNKKEATYDYELAKQNVFKENLIDSVSLSDVSIRDMVANDDSIIILVSQWDEETYDDKYKLMTLDKSGNLLSEKELSFSVPADVCGLNETQQAHVDSGEAWCNSYFGSFKITKTGNIVSNYTFYYDYYGEGEEEYLNENYYVAFDSDGNLLDIQDLKFENPDGTVLDYYLSNFLETNDGLIAFVSGEELAYCFCDENCVLDKTLHMFKDNPDAPDYYDRIVSLRDGTILLVYWFWDENDANNNCYRAAKFDVKSNSFSEVIDLPQAFSDYGYSGLVAGTDSDIIFSGNNGIYTYNLGDTDVTKMMDFINSDIDTYLLDTIIPVDNDSFYATYYDSYDYNTIFALFTRVDPKDLPDKKPIVLATVDGLDWNVKSEIIKFNKQSNEYKILIKDYAEYTDVGNAGYTKFNNDIIAGNIPDILFSYCYSTGLPWESYVNKGIFANIDELIKNDPELSQVEYMENVFDAYRNNGKLYRLVNSFSINTMLAKKSIVGDVEEFNMAAMQDAVKRLGPDAVALSETTQTGFINTLMSYSGANLVDLENGKSNLNSDEFKAYLEYAKSLPEYYDYDYDDPMYWENYERNWASQYLNNQTLLKPVYISNIDGMVTEVNGYFGGDATYVGFPGIGGNGANIEANYSLSIASQSNVSDGAWQFVRTFITEEYQNDSNHFYQLPVIKKLVKEQVDGTMLNPYWLDENNNKVEIERTLWMYDEEVPVENFTREQADELFNYICSVNKAYYYNSDIMSIIEEEVPSYFSGQKTVDDVCDVIQSRVQVYLNEQM